MCLNKKDATTEAIDLPVRRSSGGPPTIDDLPKQSKTAAIPKTVKDVKAALENRREERKLAKTYGALVTDRNVSKIVDNQKADEASEDYKIRRENKCQKWVDGVAGDNGQSSS